MDRKNGKIHARIGRWILAVCMACLVVTQAFMGAGILEAYAESDSIQEPDELYAQAAVLMDADSGRILFAKNGDEERAMASTTKIMTCILALENGNLDQVVTASAEAAAQPEVHLGVREGQQFVLRDLLYSLMLESHNDSAVVIAESIGQTVEGFADMMNAKARELDCEHTYFITPNGLDDADENGTHHTTAADLARIMKYCIIDSPQRNVFLEITQTPEYQFADVSGEHNYFCANHNTFLRMMDGALSGKTGFTSEAGYCYVGAVESEGRTFVAALLACGWPNNKGYKWADMKRLMAYGTEHFHYRNIYQKVEAEHLPVKNGAPADGSLNGEVYVEVTAKEAEAETEILRLLRDDEEIRIEKAMEQNLSAPVEAGQNVGEVRFLLGEDEVYSCRLMTASEVEKRDFEWCFRKTLERILMK